jgi:hypothetical protein
VIEILSYILRPATDKVPLSMTERDIQATLSESHMLNTGLLESKRTPVDLVTDHRCQVEEFLENLLSGKPPVVILGARTASGTGRPMAETPGARIPDKPDS